MRSRKNISIEEQYQEIVKAFPNVILVNDMISRINIPIINNSFIDIAYAKYPKRPKVYLINSNKQVYKRLDLLISSLTTWKKNNAPTIVELINEILVYINGMTSKEITIKRGLLNGILALCREQHPREILGLLRVDKGIVTEFILPPGALTSNISGVFFPNRIPLDPSLEGTIHSHPSGNPNPSLQDLNDVFKKKRFHLIVGYPYNLNKIKCFDRNGNELNFKIIN